MIWQGLWKNRVITYLLKFHNNYFHSKPRSSTKSSALTVINSQTVRHMFLSGLHYEFDISTHVSIRDFTLVDETEGARWGGGSHVAAPGVVRLAQLTALGADGHPITPNGLFDHLRWVGQLTNYRRKVHHWKVHESLEPKVDVGGFEKLLSLGYTRTFLLTRSTYIFKV